MADVEKAEHRAVGAFSNFLCEMKEKLEREGRSEDYKSAFWDNLANVAYDFAGE